MLPLSGTPRRHVRLPKQLSTEQLRVLADKAGSAAFVSSSSRMPVGGIGGSFSEPAAGCALRRSAGRPQPDDPLRIASFFKAHASPAIPVLALVVDRAAFSYCRINR
jgi:hypothetical protein